MERTFEYRVNEELHYYSNLEEMIEDAKIEIEDENTYFLEIYDTFLKAVIIEYESGILNDKLGLLE